jgi:hypothetical protein
VLPSLWAARTKGPDRVPRAAIRRGTLRHALKDDHYRVPCLFKIGHLMLTCMTTNYRSRPAMSEWAHPRNTLFALQSLYCPYYTGNSGKSRRHGLTFPESQS